MSGHASGDVPERPTKEHASGRRSGGQHAPVKPVEVEVFPIEPNRWIAVIETPDGPFSTEARSPVQVELEVRDAIATVLGRTDVELILRDDVGGQWSLESAREQAARLLAPWWPMQGAICLAASAAWPTARDPVGQFEGSPAPSRVPTCEPTGSPVLDLPRGRGLRDRGLGHRPPNPRPHTSGRRSPTPR